MSGDRATLTPENSSHASPSAAGESITLRRSRDLGYGALLLLTFALPFDMERQPILWTPNLSVTNLTVLIILVATVAAITISGLAFDALRGVPEAVTYFVRRRLPLALLAAFLGSSIISIVLAGHQTQSLTWLLALVTGALLWLAIPLWLAGNTSARMEGLGIAIVAGAGMAAIAGLVEMAVGPQFDRYLLLFKFGPDTMGPFLRLSATFSSANVAAMYFELALAFALTGFLTALSRLSLRGIVLVVWLAVIDILVIALVLTYSRGALLGLLADILAVMIAGRGTWRRRATSQYRIVILAVANIAFILGLLAVTLSPIEALRFSTQNDRTWYQAAYVSSVPPVLAAGQPRTMSVIVQNRSPLTWTASIPHSYGLSYHWFRRSMAVIRFTNAITWLSSDLPPGGRQKVLARVTPPPAAGRYLLAWDVIWKGTTWFAPKTGAYQTYQVRVVEPALASSGPDPPSPAPRSDIAYLPSAPALDRSQIWTLALEMFGRRPLFGMGSQGFRMNYPEFASASLPSRPPPHAHNLELEMLADWGVVGGGLFAALLIVLWWPLAQRVRKGHVTSVWELAVIGAAAALFGHELVDYFLTKQAFDVFFWLLCGLAAAMPQVAGSSGGVPDVRRASR